MTDPRYSSINSSNSRRQEEVRRDSHGGSMKPASSGSHAHMAVITVIPRIRVVIDPTLA